MHGCPGCGRNIPEGMFLCLPCADAAPDALIVRIGAALDTGDEVAAETAIEEAVAVLNGE